MILVDTNIIIDFWKDINFKNDNIFNDYEIAICPIVKVELIHGAKTEKQKKIIIKALNELTLLSITDEIWDYLGDLLYKLKTKGITIPFQDALIASVTIVNNCQLWTNDKHFLNIKKEIKKLKLFTP